MLFCIYLYNIAMDPEYLKKIVENFAYDAIIVLPTVGGGKIITQFYKKDP